MISEDAANEAEPLDELARLRRDLERANHLLAFGGTVEIAVRNPNVASYCEHWEQRALKAEAALTAHEANSVSPDVAELERLMRGYQLECNECEQIAGKALGYPWYKDDQKNCPGATEADGVCVGEHVPSSVVAELARHYTEANSVSSLREALEVIAGGDGDAQEIAQQALAANNRAASPPEPDALAVIEADVIRRMAKHVSEFYTDYASEDKQEAARDIEAMLLDQAALAAYDKAKRPTLAVAADTEELVKEAEDWKRRAGEQRTRHYERGLVDRLIASLRKGAGT